MCFSPSEHISFDLISSSLADDKIICKDLYLMLCHKSYLVVGLTFASVEYLWKGKKKKKKKKAGGGLAVSEDLHKEELGFRTDLAGFGNAFVQGVDVLSSGEQQWSCFDSVYLGAVGR